MRGSCYFKTIFWGHSPFIFSSPPDVLTQLRLWQTPIHQDDSSVHFAAARRACASSTSACASSSPLSCQSSRRSSAMCCVTLASGRPTANASNPRSRGALLISHFSRLKANSYFAVAPYISRTYARVCTPAPTLALLINGKYEQVGDRARVNPCLNNASFTL